MDYCERKAEAGTGPAGALPVLDALFPKLKTFVCGGDGF